MSDIADKANQLNMDYRDKVKNAKCLTCKNGCASFEYTLTGDCIHYVKRMSLNEIKKELKIQNVNLRRLCKDNGLKYWAMKDMLNNKLVLSYRYYCALEEHILEKREYIPHIERELAYE